MNTTEKSRRNVLRLAGAGLAATSVATVAANEALAYQGNMERAVSSLYSALGSLRESTSDKGGHRVKAMRLIQQAITEVQSGIEFAAEKFGD
ncbi:hypothetical protein EV668_2027 [Enterovirga rhinocerotis]|uniref:Secreted protein n=2 Tax=Enterovirga rhinocerotis TaxID=1339210 RepID=A0A4V3DZ17_9HYPH|nr:hypothetical protein EV668_2027 [Enterovirga rhinocerotis]